MLRLFYSPGSWALAFAHRAREGADYAVARIDFSKSEQRSPDYLKLDPKGRVPALVTKRMSLRPPGNAEYATRSAPGGPMKTPKTINRILRSQEPASAAPIPRSWRCQFCGRRFTDRTHLLEYLNAEQRRQEEINRTVS
jgi:hypothetical protein